MYNLKAAVSRLEFGSKPKEMEVTEIATGHFVFAPVAGEKVVYELLEKAITGAGYEIEASSISVAGSMTENRHLETPDGQVFHLTAADENLKARLAALEPGTRLRVEGAWKVLEGAQIVEVASIGVSGDDEARYEERE